MLNYNGTIIFMKVVSIIADIIKSKEIINRVDFQNNLKNKLNLFNSNSKSILSPYIITLGDEFQALYKSTDEIFTDLFNIWGFLYPVKMRVAIGIDKLATDINKESAIGMDGPAFHVAREGIEKLKNKDFSIIQIYDSSKRTDIDYINKSLTLVMSEINDWKKNTLLIFNEMLNNKAVNDIYPSVGISQRGVYKLINTNKIDYYVDFFKSLNIKINEMYNL